MCNDMSEMPEVKATKDFASNIMKKGTKIAKDLKSKLKSPQKKTANPSKQK